MTLADAHHEVVDVHAHILLEGVMNTCGHAGPEMGVRDDGTQFFRAADYVLENVKFVNSAFSNAQMRIEQMDALGLDKQLVSPNPITYFYHQPISDALSFHQRTNLLLPATVTHAFLVQPLCPCKALKRHAKNSIVQ